MGVGVAVLVADSTSEPAVRAGAGGLAAGLLALAVLSTRTRVEAGDDGVRVFWATRSAAYPWTDVARFALDEHQTRTGERVKAPLLVLRSGEAVRLPALHDFDPVGFRPLKGVQPRIETLEQARTTRD